MVNRSRRRNTSKLRVASVAGLPASSSWSTMQCVLATSATTSTFSITTIATTAMSKQGVLHHLAKAQLRDTLQVLILRPIAFHLCGPKKTRRPRSEPTGNVVQRSMLRLPSALPRLGPMKRQACVRLWKTWERRGGPRRLVCDTPLLAHYIPRKVRVGSEDRHTSYVPAMSRCPPTLSRILRRLGP